MKNENIALTASDNPEEAMNILEQNKIDIVVTDYRMPVMDGIELSKILKGKYNDLKIVLMSGDVLTLDKTTESMFSAVLNKPVSGFDILSLVHKLCDNV